MASFFYFFESIMIIIILFFSLNMECSSTIQILDATGLASHNKEVWENTTL